MSGSQRHRQCAITVVVDGLLQYTPNERSIFSEALLVAQACCPLVSFTTSVKILVFIHDFVVEARVELVYEIVRSSYVVEIDFHGPLERYGANHVFFVGLYEMGEGVA